MWENLVAQGGTNLMCPLNQAIDMVGKTGESIPLIFLITDGTVENERDIFNMVKCSLVDGSMSSPRIYTFGIGSYCNHHFLEMLAHIGRGYYDAAYETGSIDDRFQRLLENALSPMLINLTLDALEKLKSYELYPSRIPDLVYGRPLIVSGRFHGKFPECVKVSGIIGDQSSYVIDIKVRKRCDINLEMICAKREVDLLTARAWLDQNIHLEEKVAKMSLQRGIPSEYTCMIVAHNDKIKSFVKSFLGDEKSSKSMNQKAIYMRQISVGFGNLKATATNLPPGIENEKLTRAATIVMNAASSFYGVVASSGCWRCLSELKNSQCFLAIAQLCTAFACLEFLDCCCDLCDSCMDLCQ
uniref:von Willebrand factor A domain-containing protein DDB_G0292028-like n=1 Tax=Erigeron canadensis TaxID=72917 RepID=UPI001CB90CB7|nr:von Willebrand factor A domain-containing protein DDB_G0292028-like [Erigeron canadensis]